MTNCVICGGIFTGCGNNAEPLAEGRCCDRCNDAVIMARLHLAGMRITLVRSAADIPADLPSEDESAE